MSGVVTKVHSRRRSKRCKVPAASADRISKLPEDVIVHILSFLPIRDCIKTGSLAKNWKFLWTQVPHLEFDEKSMGVHNGDFTGIVNKTLSAFSDSKVKSFLLKRCPNSMYEPYYDSWCRFAVEKKIENFEFDVPYHTLPQLVYTSSSFEELLFSNCHFYIQGSVFWNSLKKLTILYPRHLKSLEKIVAGAPALEILDLTLYFGITQFHFANLVHLKKLTLHISGWDREEGGTSKSDAEIEISAPSVESLQVSGSFPSWKLLDAPSLLEARVDRLWIQYPVLTQQVVHSLLNVHTLKLDYSIIQGIAKLPVSDLPTLPKCKCLILNTDLWKEDPGAIATLLQSTPGIETLIVTCHQEGRSSKRNYWTFQETGCNYLTNLTTVKFFDFSTSWRVVLPFVEFVLKYAIALQKVIIYLETKDDIPAKLVQISQKISSFPRSSPDAKVLIHR